MNYPPVMLTEVEQATGLSYEYSNGLLQIRTPEQHERLINAPNRLVTLVLIISIRF